MSEALPISKTLAPATQDELRDQVRSCFEAGTAMYPIGGGTSLGFGLPAKEKGVGLSLAGLNRVVDFPARDMTITVEAGITMKALAETLATEKQQLPVDVPLADRATLGGVIATNCNGPRRYGYGSLRDYVIGIHAIDGRGTPFKGGGRVVKNVAGYDFCKLLTGSLGTLGVISQVTLRLRPVAERSVLVACAVDDLGQAEKLLAALVHSETTPVAIELASRARWTLPSASLAPMIPEPTTAASSIAVPAASARERLASALIGSFLRNLVEVALEHEPLDAFDRQTEQQVDSIGQGRVGGKERPALVFARALYRRGIGHPPVGRYRLAGPERAGVGGSRIAHGDDDIHLRRTRNRKLIPALASHAVSRDAVLLQ